VALGADIGTGLAAIGAIAAAVSARASARNVALSNRPYVYGEQGFSSASRSPALRLHNDGSGAAVEVRYRTGAPRAGYSEWSEPVRAMRPGEITPPPEAEGFLAETPRDSNGTAIEWFIETEFSDISGARWRLRNDRRDNSPATVQRLRTRPYQRWLPPPSE
jgi:hypothetical protein